MTIDDTNKHSDIYGLIGHPLAHSYSKEIHEALGRYTYELFSLESNDMMQMVKSRRFAGLNVTIPYKRDVLPLCDTVTSLANAIGAVNTLYFDAANRLVGHNTDYEGFLYAAERAGIDFAGKDVLILGSGGTSHTTRKAVSDGGAHRVYIASRQVKPGGDDISQTDKTPIFVTYDALPSIAEDIDIIINTTPVGMFPNTMQSLISLHDFPQCSGVFDVIYNPFRTALLLDAAELNIPHSDGLPMLVAQATAAAGYFLGTPDAFTAENERIIGSMRRQIQNIVLIGMPGCGKSTVGMKIAEITGKRFVDMDDAIEKHADMTIPEIFTERGEQAFRDMESSAATELGKERGLVIATGGGVILRRDNIRALRQNAMIVHVKRPLDNLAMRGRPLSKDKNALSEMQKIRMPLYEAAADLVYDNIHDPARMGDDLEELLSRQSI